MRTRRLAMTACLVLTVLFVLDLALRPGGTVVTRTIDDIAELVAAAVAGAAGLWRARQLHHRARASWGLLGAACLAWAAGEAVWSYFEIIAGTTALFPSAADVGFLLFPVLALIGLLVRPSAAFSRQGRALVALDALLVSASLMVINWVTALGAVYRQASDSTLAAAVSLAYPGTDVVLLTVALVVVTFARTGNRAGLLSLALGIGCLTVGDSGFAYLTAKGSYGAVNLIDAGWVAGFLVVAVAALVDDRVDADIERDGTVIAPRLALLLPFIPTAIAAVVVLNQTVHRRLDYVGAVATCAILVALAGRQMLVLLDNRALMSRITHQAFHDELTGLANRALFADRLSHALELHRRDMRMVSVLLIDLDDFKTINDSLGHPAGDELLVRISERLRAVVRSGDTVARLGGDEFAVLLEDGGEPIDVASRLLASLEQAVVLEGRTLPVGASIGIVTLRPDDVSATSVEMLKRADMAMYAAKRSGKATLCTYSSDLDDAETGQLDLRAAFASDVDAGRIDAAYQPIHLADGRLSGFEALARWNYRGTAVSPATFLPMARRLGLAPALDRLVIAQAVAEAATWADHLTLSVNLDATTLADPTFSTFMLGIVGGSMPPHRLFVEVLETGLIEDDETALKTLERLRATGVRVAVDDFGAGYASLVRLQALRPDVVKIDRSLMAALGGDEPTPLLAGVAQLAHRIGATVVAEGVETEGQLAAALAAGCDAVQGFLLGRPMTAHACHSVMRAESAPLV